MIYSVSRAEKLQMLGIFLALDVCVSYLFFRSAVVFVLLLPAAPLFFKEQEKSRLQKQKKVVTGQFLDAMQLMLTALQAGCSPENALHETAGELRKIYDSGTVIVREFVRMDAQVRVSRSLEELLTAFARRTDIPDILSFAEVFQTAKRTGGDLIAVIRNTISCIRQKQETMQEIETCLSGKIMEQNVMSVIPLFILAYVNVSSPGFLDVMYETVTGMVTMGVCFVLYVAAYLWGQSIVRIEV